MNQSISKILAGIVFAASVIGAYEIGRRAVSPDPPSSESSESASTPESFGDNPYDDTEIQQEEPAGDLAPLETLTTDPSLPHVSFVDPATGQGVRTLVVVGAPGIWPPETRTSGPRGGVYLPQTDVETLRGGSFHHYELMARSSADSLAYWDDLEFEQPSAQDAWPQKQLQMEPAAPVEIRVTDADGRPVSGVKVQLSRQQIGFVTLNKRVDPEGRARFRTIPSGTYVASAGLDGARRVRTSFTHDSAGPTTLALQLESGADPGPEVAETSSETSSGSERRDIAVQIDGLAEREWQSASFHWRRAGGEWQLGRLQRSDGGGTRQWTKRLHPGRYQLRVLGEGDRRDERTIEVGGDSVEFQWSVEYARRMQLYVQDASGGPVAGALVQIWRDEALVDSAVSRGTDPVELSFDVDSTFTVVAIDSRRGETVRRVDPRSAGGEVILTLDQSLLSAQLPPERVRRTERIEEILGAPLVRDNQSLLIDVTDPGSRAAKAGLERADRLMSLHEIGSDRWEAIVERDGQIVDVQIR